MVADRAYWPGLVETSNGQTSLLYFAAAVPTVGSCTVLLTSTSMPRRSKATQRPAS
jgi:hypothetical protein